VPLAPEIAIPVVRAWRSAASVPRSSMSSCSCAGKQEFRAIVCHNNAFAKGNLESEDGKCKSVHVVNCCTVPRCTTACIIDQMIKTTATKSIEEQLAHAQSEIARLQELVRVEATRRARFPWENPEIVQAQPRIGYNFKFEPELYLKVKWITANVGGMKSMQVFLDKAANLLADQMLEKHGAN
jgi:hypothetical protein